MISLRSSVLGLWILAAGIVLLGCGGDSDDAQASSGVVRFEAESACLLESQYEPCGVFSEALVREVFLGRDSGVDQDTELKQKSYSKKPREPKSGRRNVLSSRNLSNCKYEWSNGLKHSISMPGGSTMEIDRDAEVSLNSITQNPENPIDAFERKHRALTDDELASLNASVERKLEEAQAEGKIPEAGKAVGKGLVGMIAGGIAYNPVDSLGTRAVWESKHSLLSVLVDSVDFTLSVYVSDDAAENREAATAIGEAVLAACG